MNKILKILSDSSVASFRLLHEQAATRAGLLLCVMAAEWVAILVSHDDRWPLLIATIAGIASIYVLCLNGRYRRSWPLLVAVAGAMVVGIYAGGNSLLT
ncbi:hypothetical protein ANOBCDAF_03338 [Pleomorphomonas sp. T1.2MG-36]|uniref:hypothetical protein n=1 Tax=Pleomorphomonas sp. T1.2MG-36 TaxID=3041167 RepID=UPI0024779C1A|nr:hypothetical protein [Pleomorphomonas sp. T1.2MG-36]CAI9414946.1 hypothetical protein ANOBCDAF_03338 [Pleomorphomonas sp. T1.2MG-36]